MEEMNEVEKLKKQLEEAVECIRVLKAGLEGQEYETAFIDAHSLRVTIHILLKRIQIWERDRTV